MTCRRCVLSIWSLSERDPDLSFLSDGTSRRTRWTIDLPSTAIISVSSALVRLEVRRRRWLLPPLVRTNLPVPVWRNRLEVALWVFILVLPGFFLRGTALLLSIEFRG
jgi:hypothetical protein